MPVTRSATAIAAGTVPKTSTASSSKPPASPMRPAVKRSASIASLPTPPRTLHKRRGRGRVEPIAEEDGDGELPTVAPPPPPTRATRSQTHAAAAPIPVQYGRKRQRVGFTPALPSDDVAEADEDADEVVTKPKIEVEEAEEDAFWLDKPSPKAGPSTSKLVEPPSPGGLLDQPNRIKVRAPVSPPPSTHKPRPPVTPKAKVTATLHLVAPVTPPPRRSLRSSGPIRDSGSNPFLDDSPGSQLTLSPPNPTSPTPLVEPPTLTYVFRGTRALVANPHYRKDLEAEARSRLPEDHPDYEPLENCAPTRLFAKEVAEIRRRQPMRQAKLLPRTPSPTRAPATAETSTSRVPKTPTRRAAEDSPKAALDKALGPLRGGRR